MRELCCDNSGSSNRVAKWAGAEDKKSNRRCNWAAEKGHCVAACLGAKAKKSFGSKSFDSKLAPKAKLPPGVKDNAEVWGRAIAPPPPSPPASSVGSITEEGCEIARAELSRRCDGEVDVEAFHILNALVRREELLCPLLLFLNLLLGDVRVGYN